ncbi:MAG TPA: FTR1 family protein [Candidatus Nanoarchaeia archaeon]|nr:FTR1 family protein [Candidatus Nanoarchaeia archaeon]
MKIKTTLWIICILLFSMASYADSGAQGLIGTLKLINAEYADAVKDEKVIDEGEYLETEIFLEKALDLYEKQEKSSEMTERLEVIKSTVAQKGDPSIVNENINKIIAILQEQSGSGTVSEDAKGEANQQSLADSELSGEQVIGGLRVGLIIDEAEDFYLPVDGELVKNPAEAQHLKVVLREKDTKRMIPYTLVSASIQGNNGWKQEIILHPLWGRFFYYGNNANLADGRYKAIIIIEHGGLAHHELDKWIEPIKAVFEFNVKDGVARIDNQPGIATTEGFLPGDDIDIAVAELWEERKAGKYSIGFIAESVEEIYAFKSGKLVSTVKGSELYHLEAVVREASTGRILPYADISMQLTKGKESLEYNLVPMWAEFFHYAANADVDEGIWHVKVMVKPSILGYLDKEDAFEEATVEFTFDTSRISGGGIAEIKGLIGEAINEYKEGNTQEASKLAKEAFITFEEGVGKEISARDSSLEDEIEKDVLALSRIKEGYSDIDKLASNIYSNLERAQGILESKSNAKFLYLQSLTIIVREGFEAIIIIAAIIAYLAVSGNKQKISIIYKAAGLAILASLLTAWLIEKVFGLGFASREILEGATMLIAVIVLFYVSYWLVSKIQADRWQRFIEGKVADAITKGNKFLLGSVAFLAVYREGFETVLFYNALLIDAPASPIIAGFLSGIIVLCIVYFILKRYSTKIPVKQFFIITSAILYYMAFTFMGKGIAELQEGGVVPMSPLSWAPDIPVLGMYPTVETFVMQSILVIALAASLLYTFLWKPLKADGLK